LLTKGYYFTKVAYTHFTHHLSFSGFKLMF
jgi:hypothetical protein